MAERILFPQWRDSHEPTKYPFADDATLRNGDGDVIDPAVFLDGTLYPIGGRERMYLSQVEVTSDSATITIGDAGNSNRAAGSFNILDPPDRVKLVDSFGRPAGMFVSTPDRLAIFQSWMVGLHAFEVEGTEFAATVCVPTPEIGLRGILLEDGSLFTGDIWLVGDDGVVLSAEKATADPVECGGQQQTFDVIRVDIVGDPLFRRRLCTNANLFETPRFIRSVTVTDEEGNSFTCVPDDLGNIVFTVGSNLTDEPILRVRTIASGLRIEAVGEQLEGGV